MIKLRLENPCYNELVNTGQDFLKTNKLKEQIKKLHSYNILLDSPVFFGLAEHTKNTFAKTIEFVNEIDQWICQSIIEMMLM